MLKPKNMYLRMYYNSNSRKNNTTVEYENMHHHWIFASDGFKHQNLIYRFYFSYTKILLIFASNLLGPK